jgi:dehydrogenase/reductase SDR family protein 7B
MIDYKDKIILITGASSGIGKACAFEFGILGATIALTGRNENKLISLKSKLTDLNINSHFFVCNLMESESSGMLVDQIEKHFKNSIDILINSAGIAVLGDIENIPINALRENFELNFYAPFLLSKLVMPGMKKKKFGQIINISSGVGKRGLPGTSSYTATKFALNGFSECLRVELMIHNIDVILISPGLVDSEFSSNIKQYGIIKNSFSDGKGLKPSEVASYIVDASKKRKREVVLSFKTKIGTYLNFFLPSFLDRYLNKEL